MVPISYGTRNLVVRWKMTLMTASGFMLVVTTLIVMLAFVNGVRTVCVGTGHIDNVLVFKDGSHDEILSELDEQTVSQIEAVPGVLRGNDGRPMASRELYMVITQQDGQTDNYHEIQARGVSPVALDVHRHVRVVEGRFFRQNRHEIIVGASFARARQLEVGDTLRMGKTDWDVVGIFQANGSAYESEAWCDLAQLAENFRNRKKYSSVVLRASSPDMAKKILDYIEDSRAIKAEARTETNYYRQQTEEIVLLRTGATVVAFFMAIGAVFGVTNTMFAAISERIKDIAIMRLLGFKRSEILISFLLEAMLIAVIGGALGLAVGYAINGITLTTVLGSKSVAFAFNVDTTILIQGAVSALAMGVVGGILPAFAAMRVEPIESMR